MRGDDNTIAVAYVSWDKLEEERRSLVERELLNYLQDATSVEFVQIFGDDKQTASEKILEVIEVTSRPKVPEKNTVNLEMPLCSFCGLRRDQVITGQGKAICESCCERLSNTVESERREHGYCDFCPSGLRAKWTVVENGISICSNCLDFAIEIIDSKPDS
jgi:hypothetical protein